MSLFVSIEFHPDWYDILGEEEKGYNAELRETDNFLILSCYEGQYDNRKWKYTKYFPVEAIVSVQTQPYTPNDYRA